MSQIHISSSPHFTLGSSTQKIMLCVLIAMLPEVAYGTYLFGLHALAVVLVSAAGCIVFEALFQILTKQKVVVSNLSAAVSGVLLALVLPPSTPLWMVLCGDLVAVVIAKGLFGGIGSNVFNPALTGRAFLFISFPAAIGSSWTLPRGVDAVTSATNADAVSSATVLSQIKSGVLVPSKSDWLDFFIGTKAGCIGETSVMLLLASFLFLLITRIIDWRAPLAMIATAALSTFIYSSASAASFMAGAKDTLTALLTGGLVFGAVFMVTDYATTPVTKPGRLVFGFGCGLITFLIRNFGGYPEGVMFSILIMNAVAPFLNNLTQRMYGYGKKGHRLPEPKKIVQTFDLTSAREEEVK
ncbi:RnfABCDGE type electron transport complex subunit D [Treponema sp.]|jgi:electron transport complex protein RnfD|uniref:RnfABCDGE type electron transport complex subunit D n=1 Tax=Treponema sp. TaxID=166 RepID=UPI0025807251|nr:RnfABCDGE type electron transport complex subunit D [Treponema sp.]MBE6354058.1 RnfABCDGE type electron transport complex subunit D [Treponema sp.]